MPVVGFVGLGAMGRRMAQRLLDDGHELVVWNRDAAKAGLLRDRGAAEARTPAEAARLAEVVIVMVSDAPALRAVTEVDGGIVAGAAPTTTVIQMSTVGSAAVTRLAALMPEGQLVDAPVLGSLPEAESGTLRIFAGGEPSPVARWTPLLSTLGTVVHVGPVGAGTAAKLVANATLFAVLGMLGEALALAEALHLPRGVTFDVLAATPLAAQAERRRASIESDEYPLRFALSLALKDADLILEAGETSGVELRLAAAARTWLADAAAAGFGDEDYAAVLRRILRPP